MPTRFFGLGCLALLWGCASTPGAPLRVDGSWTFEGIVGEPVYGMLTFLPDDRVRVRCRGEQEREPRRSETRGSEVRFSACGLAFRVRRDREGGLYALVTGRGRESYETRGPCIAMATDAEGRSFCADYATVTRYRTVTVRGNLPLRPVGPGPGL